MAPSPLRLKSSSHIRSLSLPAKSNPDFSGFEETLYIVQNPEVSCSSLPSITKSLDGLKNLYSKIDDLLQLPHSQPVISRESRAQWADRVLDRHIILLDACSVTKDHVSLAKHSVQELLSGLRRRDANSIHCYLDSRRESKKAIRKSLRGLRSFQVKKDGETVDLVFMLKVSEIVTFEVLDSLLSYLIGVNKVQERQSGWGLVAKLMGPKKIEPCQNEFEKIDGFLRSSREGARVEDVMSQIKRVESGVQILEEGLECLFRQLIKTRVFLLNWLNH